MKEYVIVKYKFQLEICKTEPIILGVFNSYKSAELKCKKLHRALWRQIIKEGIKNDTFEYYSEKIKSKGFNFTKNANEKEINEFVEFIETGEVKDPYVVKTDLKPLRIAEIEEVEASISNDFQIRLVIKEDYLYDTGDNYINPENNNFGNPIYITNNN